MRRQTEKAKNYKTDCFAFAHKPNGAAMCTALKKIECNNCAFFKSWYEEYKQKGRVYNG